jgi:outer membrane protein
MNRQFIVAVVASLALLISVGLFAERFIGKRLTYVQLQKVFAAFDMAKEYNKRMESVKYERKAILDSMELRVNALARRIESGEKDKMMLNSYMDERELYFKTRENFETDNQKILEQFNGEIFKQLSQYTLDFGKEKGYDFIFGAEGSGVVMYAKDQNDVSDELIKYINEKYHGKK